jgi:hypothetical protein
MKKSFVFLSLLLIPIFLFAQNNTGSDYSVGKIAGLVVVAGFVIWGISRWRRKKKS